MNCEGCGQVLSEYLDGDLTEEAGREAREHLEICKPCRRKLGVLERIAAVAKELPRHAPGTEVVLDISSSIHSQSRTGKKTEFGPVMDIEEVADFLRVEKQTVEESLDEIPCFELGGHLLFRKKSIEEWIEDKEKSFGVQMWEPDIDRMLFPRNVALGGKRWKI